jgi:hypothetical protein
MKERHKHPNTGQTINQEKHTEDRSAIYDDEKMSAADIKDAHASGIGSLERSDENQIEKMNNDGMGNDDNVY